MTEINRLLLEMKRNYFGNIVFVVIGCTITILGIISNIFAVIGFGIFVILLGALMFKKTSSHNKLVSSMLESYQEDPTKVIKMLETKIEELNYSISKELEKADRGGKDSKDSYDDAQRKTGVLNKWIKIKDLITEKYISFK